MHEVDDDEAVDDVGEVVVEVEAEELAAELEVLAEQHREAFAIELGVGDDGGEIGGCGEDGAGVEAAAATRPGRSRTPASPTTR